MDFLIAIFLGFANGRRAVAKGYPRARWIFLTVLAFVMLEGFAGLAMLLILYKEQLLSNPQSMMGVLKDFAINAGWTQSLLLVAIGFGGYLLIRYILERMPDNSGQNSNPV